MKKLVAICIVLGLITVMLVACGGGDSGDSSQKSSSNNTVNVHMDGADFVQSTVTLKKGDSINLLNDSAGVHIVKNGTYEGTAIKQVSENGAPIVNHQFNGNDSDVIGPFTTAGNYHFYCTVHLGMNLTVTVQ